MSERDELIEWMAAWQADAPISRGVHDEIHRRLRASQWRWRAVTAVEVVIGTVGLLVIVPLAWLATNLIERVAMTSLAVVVMAACIVAWRFRRGIWVPAAATTDAYVRFLIERARGRLRMARLGAWFLVVEIVIYIPWIWSRAASPRGTVPGFALLALISTLLAVGLYVQRRLAQRELDHLMALQNELR
jgi:hypothetical protein